MYAGILLLAVIILNFGMMHLAPGDVADSISQSMGGADEEVLNEIRATYGLDRPFIVQLGSYIGKVMRFDLGYSFFYTQPVSQLIFQKLPATLLLVLTAQFVALIVGVFLGVYSAQRPNGLSSHFVSFFALFGYSAPVFWSGLLLLIGFSLHIQWFPVAGMRDVTIEGNFLEEAIDIIRHMVLPVITLASIFLALYSRLSRATMMEVLGSDYIRTAKSKGLTDREIIYKHALKNSLSPVITLAGLQFSAVVSGAILVESVFSWPGLGTLAFESIIARDTPTILGILFFSALVVIVGNLLTDLALRLVDPRVRTNG
ncbi:MAG: ABC transporter permease [Rhodobacteraceae bacterium]|nr:MAG: ABC transporter permease [Paracoccaceae bacterium]|tara:strand:- start:302 stop:1246 length:945 start_codon:yes stop_codon:yes gene_type:complete